MFNHSGNTPIVRIVDSQLDESGVEVCIKREDLLDQYISGNKFRKLKYNVIEAANLGHDTLLTFGGAYSNHIHALAYAGMIYNFKTIGIIRGELTLPLNPTLQDARKFGMRLCYVSRANYRDKDHPAFIEKLIEDFGKFFLVPEGGSNTNAVRGCTDIVDETVVGFDYICCTVGTGGTLAGIIAGMDNNKNVLGFPVLKNGGFLKDTITRLLTDYTTKYFDNWQLMLNYHFGGYAKFDQSLVSFINQFKSLQGIPLDPIYTGKLMYGIFDLVKEGFFKRGDRILAIHTGGLQGIAGFNQRHGNIIE
jgi:1-aminocyclopropane-1-carboxylate deaminase